MNIIEKCVPDIIKFKTKKRNHFEKIWREVFEERIKYTTKKRAKHSATIAVYSAIINEEFSNILPIKRKNFVLKKNKKYKTYKLKIKKRILNVIITTKKKVLEDYKHINTKGRIINAIKEYDQEILSKIIKKYNLNIHPNTDMYYVIYNEGEE